MDKSIGDGDESNRRNESLASGSRCSGSIVPINSIAIDINCAVEEIESPKHEHFSIRGFVSEKRKKDKKTCLPFASEADDINDDNINLPPLSAPKFRWWQCSECVPGIADQNSTLGLILAEQSNAGTSSYQNVGVVEKDNYFLTNCIQNIGDEYGSRDARDYPSDKVIELNPQCTEGHKTATNVMDNNESTHITDTTNPVQTIETRNNKTPADKPKNMSSGSRETVCSAPYKRKRKLRSLAEIINEDKSLTSEQHPKTKSTQIEADINHRSHELDVSSDVAKVMKTPHRRRKLIILDDDDMEPLEMDPPIVTSKRSKGPVTEAENFTLNNNNNNTCKQVEILESGPERDNRPAPLDLRISAKTQQQHKARKQKSFDLNRKAKRIDTGKKKTVTTKETGFSNMGNVGPLVKNSLFGQQKDNVYETSKGKRPEEGECGYYVPPSNKSGPGDCNVQEKVTFLDLSLSSFTSAEQSSEKQETSRKHTGLPDLNESYIEKTSSPDPTLHENWDISASFGKETGREGKRPLVEHQPIQNIDNSTVGASDDIPMEIVELLAKNQHERTLDNSRKHLVSESIHKPFIRSPFAETTPGPINFPYTKRSGLSGNIRPVQGFLNFPPSTDSDKSHLGQFSPLTSGQQRMPLYSGPNPTSSGPKPRQSEVSDLLWPPRRKNLAIDLNSAQDHSIEPNNGLEDPSYKGKSVDYMKGDGKRVVPNYGSSIKEGKIGPGRYKSVGSTDAHPNETVPAMQLLSLMDQGIVSGPSLKVGPSNFLDRQSSPCNNHPRLNKNCNQQNNPFVSSSFFAKSNRSKDFPTLLNGVHYPNSSKNSFLQGQMPRQKGNSKAINSAGPSNLATQPLRSNPNLEVCTLNRNPADFSIPDARNEYMISSNDLKPKRRNSSKEKSGAGNVEGSKRYRAKKDLSREESLRK